MKRVKGTVLHVPVIHGSYAKHLGDKGTETRSHEWTVYLRPLQKADLSHFIKCVEFVLHSSFDPPVRRVSEMPYEIHEYGWGEFEVIIRVLFHDTSEKPVEFFHPLRLYENSGEVTPRPVISEHYDEIVFQDPSEKLLGLLKSTPHGPNLQLKTSHYAKFFHDFSAAESSDLKKIDEARTRLRDETKKRQKRLEELEEERVMLLREINSLSKGSS